jgi:hypothetical protein
MDMQAYVAAEASFAFRSQSGNRKYWNDFSITWCRRVLACAMAAPFGVIFLSNGNLIAQNDRRHLSRLPI